MEKADEVKRGSHMHESKPPKCMETIMKSGTLVIIRRSVKFPQSASIIV